VFSPNNDQVNDRLTVYSNNPAESHINAFRIYGRWGELMFSNTDFAPNNTSVGWDGTFRGQLVPAGVYVYVAEVVLKPGKVKVYSGDVVVVY
jgi:gliding motility-associated-like protein